MVEIRHEQIDANGLSMSVAIAGSGPAVLMMHGFPGLGYSYRHQMSVLAEAGYTAIAPDMRGYGGTDAPKEVEAYDRKSTVPDVTGLLDGLGIDKAVMVGHDFGAALAWDMPLWAPERTRALIILSVPRRGRSAERPSVAFRKMAEDHFLHFDYFKEYGQAEKELNPNTEEFLRRVFYALSGDFHYLDLWTKPSYAEDGTRNGYLDVLPDSPPLPWPWLTQEELDVYVKGFEHSGFTGGLNWYRANDLVWEQDEKFDAMDIEVPTLFIAGRNDSVVEMFGEAGLAAMRATVPQLDGPHLIDGAGHFVQMEAADEVNRLMLDFLNKLDN